MINVCVDYFETFTRNQTIKLIQDIITNNENSNTESNVDNNSQNKKKSLSKDQLEQLGIETNPEIKDYNQFISIKCKNCYTLLGVLNSENEEYLIFNSI